MPDCFVRCCHDLDRPFALARTALLNNTDHAIRHASTVAIGAAGVLRSHAGAFDVDIAARVDVVRIEHDTSAGVPPTRIVLAWTNADRARCPLPEMSTILSLFPLADGATRFELAGTYKVAAGTDVALGHHLAEVCIDRFVTALVERMGRELVGLAIAVAS